jgi:hypothetical protein
VDEMSFEIHGRNAQRGVCRAGVGSGAAASWQAVAHSASTRRNATFAVVLPRRGERSGTGDEYTQFRAAMHKNPGTKSVDGC